MQFFILIPVFVLSSILLYGLRRLDGIQRVDFFHGYFEIVSMVVGGGRIRCTHKWEKLFFAIGMIASFFLISIFLARFSLENMLILEPQRIDTFEKLAKQNISYHLNWFSRVHEEDIIELLR